VLDVEVAGEAFLEPVEQAGGVAAGDAGVVDDDVGGQGGQAGGDGPGVQVMHAALTAAGLATMATNALPIAAGSCCSARSCRTGMRAAQ
jgi:hypothetical protein